jgi:hypothetical protein
MYIRNIMNSFYFYGTVYDCDLPRSLSERILLVEHMQYILVRSNDIMITDFFHPQNTIAWLDPTGSGNVYKKDCRSLFIKSKCIVLSEALNVGTSFCYLLYQECWCLTG